MSSLTRVSGPTIEPLDREHLKLHLRLDAGDSDDYLAGIISAVRQTVEKWRGECLVAQTWDLRLDDFPGDDGDIVLPIGPLLGVSSIQYVDTNGTTQTLSTSTYIVDQYSRPARIRLAYQQDWPTSREQPNAVTIRFTCGYLVPAEFDQSSEVVRTTNHDFANNDLVTVYTTGGEGRQAPEPLAWNTSYHIVSASTSSLSLATTQSGAAINITGSGTGHQFLAKVPFPEHVQQAMLMLCGHYYENREPVAMGSGTPKEIPMGAAFLLDTDRIYNFGG